MTVENPRVAVIANPAKVDDVHELRESVTRRCIEAGWDEPLWFETTVEDPGAGMTRDALRSGATLVLACGGDGTVAACAGALADESVADPSVTASVTLALVPAGTGNLLARNLDLPLQQEAALDLALGRHGVLGLDVLTEGEHRFVVMAGIGFDAALIRDTPDELKAKVGWAAYLVGLVRALRGTPTASFTVTVDGGPAVTESCIGVLVGNVGKVQGGIAVLPDADPSDGLLDVIMLTPHSPGGYVGLLRRLLRRGSGSDRHATLLRGRTVEISAEQELPIEFDGDFDNHARRLSVGVLPQAVSIAVSEQLRHGRPAPREMAVQAEARRRFGVRTALLFAGVLVAAVLFGILLLLVRDHSAPVDRLDTSVADHFNSVALAHPGFTGAMKTVSNLGGPLAWWIILAPVAAGLLVRRRFRLAAFVAVTAIGSSLLNTLVKAAVGRARPRFNDPVAHAAGQSFPSGHAQAVTVGVGVLLAVFLPVIAPRWRAVAVALGVLWILLVGFSRIALGVHYLFDVIGAYLVGGVWLAGLATVFRAWRRELGEPAEILPLPGS